MTRLRLFVLAVTVVVWGFSATVIAEEVKLRQGDLTLNANLVMADGKTLKDGVVLMTHGTLAHNAMEIMSTLQELLAERGESSLAINLGLGLDDRHGFYDCATPHTHRHTDALDEIGIWLNWLQSKGATSVVLLGHSRGGNQTAWFAAERDDAAIKAVVLIAPATWSEKYAATDFERRYETALKPLLKNAQDLVAAGKPETWLEHTDFIYCKDTKVTAQSFVSYYQADPRRDTPYLLKSIRKPILVFAGSEDKVVKDVDTKVAPHADGKKISLVVIEGADHFFRDLYAEDIADAIGEFLSDL
ncbi:MAG: alpha/beta fold hydrolase [Pseudomonadota bacterium]|nr:MAG: alpha/beta fold hydrolase [Pseudomonadota bacterium]